MRRELLRRTLALAPRELVVCYGKKHWEHFEQLFPEITWHDDAPYRVGVAGGTRVVLTTHFSDRGFNPYTPDELVEKTSQPAFFR